MDDRTKTSGRTSEEIRAEIDRTRADMHETVDRLEARLSPGQILDELWTRMRGSGGGGAGDLVREHPVPLALMGLGAAMLAVEHSKEKHGHGQDGRGYVGSTDRADGRVGPYRGDDVDHVKFSDLPASIGMSPDGDGAQHDGAHGLKAKASEALHGASDRLHDATDALHGAGDSARDTLRNAKESVGDAASRVGELRGGLDHVIHDQPLIAGAITFGLGLAAGLAVPATRFEDAHIGATADDLKDNAKQAASRVGEKALDVAGQTAAAVKDAASDIKDAINDPQLKDVLATKAHEIGDVAQDAMRDVAKNVSEAAGGGASTDARQETTGNAGHSDGGATGSMS